MKQLITSSACTLVIMAMMIQMVHFQIAGSRLTAARSVCVSYSDEIRSDGWREDIAAGIRKDMAKLLSCREEDIDVSHDMSSLSVAVPVSDFIGLSGFWNSVGRKGKIIIKCAFDLCRNEENGEGK